MSVFITKTLPLTKKDDITDLKEFLVMEIIVNNEKCFFTCLYMSPSQNCVQFSDFCKDFSILLNNINGHRPSCSLSLVISVPNAQNGIHLTKIQSF